MPVQRPEMRLFVPCNIVNGRRLVMAAPSVEPVMHVFAFRSATQALEARAAVTSGPWRLVHDDGVLHVEALDAADSEGVAWATSPEELALDGMCGPSGFGIGNCEFVEPDTIRVLDSMTVVFEEIDYDSARARLALEIGRPM